jgi:hypothetical protein
MVVKKIFALVLLVGVFAISLASSVGCGPSTTPKAGGSTGGPATTKTDK